MIEQGLQLNAFQRRLYQFLYVIVAPVYRRLINYSYEDLSGEAPPYLILANHNLVLDPVAVACAFKNPLCFVASDHLQRLGFLTRLLKGCFGIIFRRKGTVAYSTALDILRTLKAGESVCLFAEGNRSFTGSTTPILPATGALARKAGVPVITYKIEGGYFTHPRWGRYMRRGKTRGYAVNRYSPEQLRGMTVDEVNACIRKDLFEDAYARQAAEPILYKGKRRAEYLENVLFLCPGCGSLGRLKSQGNRLFCADCGLEATYQEDGKLGGDLPFHTLPEWDAWQTARLKDLAQREGEDPILRDDGVTIVQWDTNNQKRFAGEGSIAFYRDRLEACGKILPLAQLSNMSIYERNTIVLSWDTDYYEIKGSITFCGRKYAQLYEILKELQEKEKQEMPVKKCI